MSGFIKAISYYLPNKTITNEDLSHEFPEWSVEKIAGKVGINERHVVCNCQTAGDIALEAANKLFDEHHIDRKQIDFLLLCTQSPDYFLPTTACTLQSKLALRNDIGALDYNLGCSGFVYGLSLAKGLIAGNIAQNILLITAETYSKHMHPSDKGNRTIFGDAAAAALISTEGYAEIGEFALGTDGTGANNLIVKNGGLRHPKLGNDSADDYLFMNGGEIFNFTSDAVPILIEQVLSKNKIDLSDVELVIFHQANKYMMNYLRKLIGIDKDKFYIYLEKVGNTVSSTLPIAMYHALKDRRLKGNVILAGFGVGYSWGGVNLLVK